MNHPSGNESTYTEYLLKDSTLVYKVPAPNCEWGCFIGCGGLKMSLNRLFTRNYFNGHVKESDKYILSEKNLRTVNLLMCHNY